MRSAASPEARGSKHGPYNTVNSQEGQEPLQSVPQAPQSQGQLSEAPVRPWQSNTIKLFRGPRANQATHLAPAPLASSRLTWLLTSRHMPPRPRLERLEVTFMLLPALPHLWNPLALASVTRTPIVLREPASSSRKPSLMTCVCYQ